MYNSQACCNLLNSCSISCLVKELSFSSLNSDPPSDVGEEPFCRICHEGTNAGYLVLPCECAGSLATVHRACLERWLSASRTSRCELCHFELTLEHLPKPLTEWLTAPAMQRQRRALCGDALRFLIITPLASLSGWLCAKGALELYDSITFYLKHNKNNQSVRLHIPQPGQKAEDGNKKEFESNLCKHRHKKAQKHK
uniref:RING-CH-type domain-containing protein n=1 Tax=Electrophorus electricus TaxID=8005 RepID=A0A4W4GAW8_ELEEL